MIMSTQKKVELEAELSKINNEREKMENHYNSTVKELKEQIAFLK